MNKETPQQETIKGQKEVSIENQEKIDLKWNIVNNPNSTEEYLEDITDSNKQLERYQERGNGFRHLSIFKENINQGEMIKEVLNENGDKDKFNEVDENLQNYKEKLKETVDIIAKKWEDDLNMGRLMILEELYTTLEDNKEAQKFKEMFEEKRRPKDLVKNEDVVDKKPKLIDYSAQEQEDKQQTEEIKKKIDEL